MYGISVLFSSRVVRIHSRYFSSGSSKKLLEILGNMPKTNTARIAEAQRQRQKISKKSEKYGPSTVYLQVLGSGAKGAPNTLYLFTDQKRYLFNCGECTQRLAHEHKVKLSKLDHIFITNKTWKNIGGLPGLSLTLQDVGVPNITLHGPEGLDELYNATKRFVIMKDMNVTMAKCSPNEDFEDSVMSVKYVLLGQLDDLLNLKQPVKKVKGDGASSDKEYEEFIHDDIDYYKSDKGKAIKEKPKVKVKTSVEKDPLKKKTEKVLQELQRKSNCSVAYICTLKKRLGTLDLAKCVERGVKPGPMLGQLKNGHNVVLPDGSFVLSKDVKTPDDPGPVFIVLDVPDASYLKESDFQAHFDNAGNPPENIPVLIVHFTPLHVFHDPAYRAFMAMFGPCTRHLVLNSQNTCLGSEAVHRTQHKLHLLDPDIFPLLRDVSVPAVWNAQPPVPKTNSPIRLKGLEELKNKIALAQFQNIINLEGACKGDGQIILDDADFVKPEVLVGRTLTMFHLRPRRQLDRSAEPKLHIQEYIQETMDVDGFVGSLQQFRRLVDGIRYAKSDTKEYPKVVFLGTGSCIPSKTRNTSAIVVRIDEDHSMLLDCGEGTFGQLVRFYGPKKVNAFLRTLKAIYISHLHADHHIGLIGVLQARAQAFQELPDQPQIPLYLMAPGQIVAWLNIYDQQFERIKSEFTLVPNQSLLQDTCVPNPDLTGAALAALGIQDLRTCLVAHCPNAFGVAIQINQQYKLTYSGDTLPCEELVRIGYNSTLLIHEATMEDELVDEARTKMHSTTTQAIEIGRQMNAQYTVLTHFSQRYARLPRLNANILNDNRSVGIAFDNMQITMSDLELLPHMYAPLQLMFAEHCVEMELKAAQRARAREARPMRSHEAPVTTSQPAPPAALTPKRSRDHSKEPARQPEVPVETRRCTENTKRPSVPCTRASATANYRESNASRLRQEVKGMMVTGIVGKPMHPCSRSSSCSPSKTPQRSPTRTPLPNDDSKRPSKEADPEQCPDIASTVSLTSYLGRDSGSKINRCDCETTGYVVDACSKTLSALLNRVQTVDEIIEKSANAKKTGISSRSAPSSENFYASAYGKPLVTAMNKKLVIRREMVPIGQHYSRTGLKERVSYAERARSPSLPRGSRNQTPPTPRSVSPRSHIKLPTNPTVSSNKLQSSYASSEASPDTKIPVSKTNFGSRHLRHPVVYVNKCNKYPARDSSPENRPADSKTKLKLPRHRQRETKTSRPETPLGTPPMSPTRGRSPASATVPPAMMHSGIRSFKPQLEDIKSSFLLLNKKTQDKDNKLKSCADHVKNKPYSPVSKPSPVNESLRKQQLLEAKKKFQSKQFWCDSKYDKIEGLNWISWR